MPVKYVWCGSLNLSSAISSKCLNAGLSTTLRDCNPWQIKSAVPSTSSLCFTFLFENRVDLASIPPSVSCFYILFMVEALLGPEWPSLPSQTHDTPVRDSSDRLKHMILLCMIPLKTEVQVRGVTRVQDKKIKMTNGLLFVRHHTSSICRKIEVLPDSALDLEASAHNLVKFTCSRHLRESTLAEGKLRLVPTKEYLLLL